MREVEFPFTQPFEQLLDSQNALRSAFRFFIEQNSSRDRLSLTLAAVQALNEVWFYSGSLIAFVRQEQLSTSPDQFLESISQQLPAQQLEGDATLQLGTSLWQLDASGTVQHHTLDADKLPIVCKAQYGKRVPGLGTELFVQIRNQQRDTELKLYVHTSCQAVTVKAPLAEEGVADDLQCPRGRGDAEGHWLQLILPEDAPPVLLVEMLNGPWASQQTIVDQAEAAARCHALYHNSHCFACVEQETCLQLFPHPHIGPCPAVRLSAALFAQNMTHHKLACRLPHSSCRHGPQYCLSL